MTREVPLSRGLVALVDDEDYSAVLAAGSWSARPRGSTTYAARHTGRTTQQLHTFLTGWPFVDHANGDGLDNRRANLRPATRSQNNANARLRPDSTTGYKGVTYIKRAGKWQARIRVDGHLHSLGYYADPEQAARAYDAAALEAWGEYARPNFPQEQAA